MGLDMYLKAERYVSNFMQDDTPFYQELVNAVRRNTAATIPDYTSGMQSMTISVQLVYWRKVNQVHRWFVENCADGVDNCKASQVGFDELEELVGNCHSILLSRDMVRNGETTEGELLETCNELLPPQSGFFFGSTDIDVWYFDDLQHTYDSLTAVMKWLKAEREAGHYWDLIYQASW